VTSELLGRWIREEARVERGGKRRGINVTSELLGRWIREEADELEDETDIAWNKDWKFY